MNNVIADEDGAVLANGIAGFTADESEINIYLDNYGYAIYVSGVESEKNYAAVIGIGLTNQYGSETRGVTLLLPDGTQKTVTAELVDGIAWTDFAAWNGTTVGTLGGNYENLVTDGIADIVTYTVGDDNVYELDFASATTAKYDDNYTDNRSRW